MVSHRTLIFCAGTLWLIIGIFLLITGVSLTNLTPLLLSATAVGYLKGRFILSKSAKKQVKRICGLKAPLSFKHLYSKGYYFLIFGMMAMGMGLRFLPFPTAVRAFVDIVVGLALMIGALQYYLSARAI